MRKNNCPHEYECTDFPKKCNCCKKNRRKSYFEEKEKVIFTKFCPEIMSPMQQYKFIWGEKPTLDNNYYLKRLISIADSIIPGYNKY